ncbi:hypothetical protein BDV37DRAFT_264049 [Aspergillus pseudonomiae]|uniref:Uncharacterized protein n=1 Tax=Aspergillus pseudonomiae TaxID=1506151 RepID=A0A5N7CVJ4_9EURO|nr:uncharacterized protein BDV37DRAFT_264049 [Aspergillus pseudonomiae]KAE8398161.1 hypothetical protein BDV37DRAFT_264049 [Aspergillus pseudonomiae]
MVLFAIAIDLRSTNSITVQVYVQVSDPMSLNFYSLYDETQPFFIFLVPLILGLVLVTSSMNGMDF